MPIDEANKRVTQLPTSNRISATYNQVELLAILESQRVMIKALQEDVKALSALV